MKQKENHTHQQRISTFIIALFLTILIARILVAIKDPDPFLFGFEIHHFHYGILILIISNLLLLFGKSRSGYQPILSAIGVGLILDELWYITGKTVESIAYSATIPSVIMLGAIVTAMLMMIKYDVLKKIRRKNRV